MDMNASAITLAPAARRREPFCLLPAVPTSIPSGDNKATGVGASLSPILKNCENALWLRPVPGSMRARCISTLPGGDSMKAWEGKGHGRGGDRKEVGEGKGV